MKDSKLKLLTGRSYLISPDPIDTKEILNSFETSNQIIVDSSEINIKELREVISRAQLKSSLPRILLIKSADKLSVSAQNTLLKLLEEPISSLAIVVQTGNPDRLLETVRSRLVSGFYQPKQKLSKDTDTDLYDERTAEELYKLDRNDLIELLKVKQIVSRKKLLNGELGYVVSIKLIDSAIKKLEQNTNQKLTIDNLHLQLEKNSSYIGRDR